MTTTYHSESATIRARVNHPISDSDGHTVEFEPAFLDYLRRVGGPTVLERYQTPRGKMAETALSPSQSRFSEADRRERRPLRYPWWTVPTKNTLDRATAPLPRLLYERMEELGLDFSVLYPTAGLFLPHFTERDFRDFMFVNPVTLWTGRNPHSFKGTVVENAVEKLRAEGLA